MVSAARATLLAAMMIGLMAGCDTASESTAPALIAEHAVPDKPAIPGYEQWTPYLQKVAALQARAEGCARVSIVDVSGNRGSPDSPVFYVTCEDASGRPYNTWYTKAEVDAENQ